MPGLGIGGRVTVRDSFRILGRDELGSFTCRSRTVETMLGYWCSKRVLDEVPFRAAIDPAELLPILPQIMLIDLSDNPFRARYRLVGTAVVEHTKFDFTHYYTDDILFQDEDGTDWTDCYRQVAEARLPGFGISHWQPDRRFVQWTEFIICPLLNAEGKLTQCIAAEEYEPLPEHMADTFRSRPMTE